MRNSKKLKMISKELLMKQKDVLEDLILAQRLIAALGSEN
jgi:hypothetical protein